MSNYSIKGGVKMSKKKSVHTVPNPDGGWYNKQDGKIISKHNKKSTATSAVENTP